MMADHREISAKVTDLREWVVTNSDGMTFAIVTAREGEGVTVTYAGPGQPLMSAQLTERLGSTLSDAADFVVNGWGRA